MFKPVNRYIQIKISDPEPVETISGILLPSDYEVKEEKYAQASTLAWSPDVRFADELDLGSKIIVDRSMIEEVNSNGRTMHLILDNYVLGLIKE